MTSRRLAHIAIPCAAATILWRATKLWTWLGHYTSTDCLHGVHEDCKLACKTCNARCQCRCHRVRRT
jgi:hypothetical protein